MSYPPGSTTFTCVGVTFVRVVDGDSFAPWIEPEAQYTKDAVLGGTVAYVDVGASIPPTFTLRGQFASTADRAAMRAALGTTVTLASSDGVSGSFVLVKATRVNGYGLLMLDLAFEYVP